jgi:Phytanoyl-CoA dioxygenase (PhyH)
LASLLQEWIIIKAMSADPSSSQQETAVIDEEWSSFTIPMEHFLLSSSSSSLLDQQPEKEDEKGWRGDADTTTTSTAVGRDEEEEGAGRSSSSEATASVDPPPRLPMSVRDDFQRDGFIVLRRAVIAPSVCDELNRRLEEILRGRYSTGVPPTKMYPRRLIHHTIEYEGSPYLRRPSSSSAPKVASSCSSSSPPPSPPRRPPPAATAQPLTAAMIAQRRAVVRPPPQVVVGPLGFRNQNGNVRHHPNNDRNVVKVRQVINAHRADHLFRHVVNGLGGLVGRLMTHWTAGVRLASDQVWAKPPGAPALAYHRDSPYFMFEPPEVVTVWLALDDMDAELGPLHYVAGSHLWDNNSNTKNNNNTNDDGDGDEVQQQQEEWGAMRTGFFDESSPELLRAAQGRPLSIVSLQDLPKGGLAIHDGRTWHGSPRNHSRTRPRRGYGIHYVPANVRFRPEAIVSQLWRPYVQDAVDRGEDVAAVDVPTEHFPIVWQPTTTAATAPTIG